MLRGGEEEDGEEAGESAGALLGGRGDELAGPIGSSVVAAVIQNRAAEVGVAALDLGTLRLELAQFVEASRSFATTL